MRFLTTAPPVFFRIVMPSFFSPCSFLWTSNRKWGVSARLFHRVPLKSPLFNLSSLEKVFAMGLRSVCWCVWGRFAPLSHGELFSSLGTSASDNISARCSPHPDEKAMGSFSAFIVRLICSLHPLSPRSSLELLLKHKTMGKVNKSAHSW